MGCFTTPCSAQSPRIAIHVKAGRKPSNRLIGTEFEKVLHNYVNGSIMANTLVYK